MSTYTKRVETRQYTEIVYYKDGEEIDRVTNEDDHGYSLGPAEPMTEVEISDADPDFFEE